MKSDLKNDFYLFLFSRINKFGTRTILSLISKYGSVDNLYDKLLAAKIINTDFIKSAQKDFARINENYISILDKKYPDILKKIYDPPLFLFYRGNINILQNPNLLTVVGSRTTTDYHTNCLKKIFHSLADTPLTIVSGLAMGIDSLAHREALKNNLPTIAVLASNLDDKHLYPQTNLGLAKDILNKKGLLISEQSRLSKTRLYHFPKRNRILAGLSRATIIISGAQKSGTLITAQVAVEEGRDVLALPGNINLRLSQGPNKLIGQGAGLLNSAEDILTLYNINKTIETKKIIFTNKSHAKIYSLLQTEPMKLIDLADNLKLSIKQTSTLVSEMEIKELIKYNNLNQLEII